MRILGISCFYNDSAAVLVVDAGYLNKLYKLSAASEVAKDKQPNDIMADPVCPALNLN